MLGPGKRCFILDHHHLGLALVEEGIKKIWVALQDDLSWLSASVFWRTMETHAWAHPFDEHDVPMIAATYPCRLTQLQDDPYRTLANLVHDAGGYAKSATPFAEFLWADFLRARIGLGAARRGSALVVRTGVRLARSSAARYLPGWSGRGS